MPQNNDFQNHPSIRKTVEKYASWNVHFGAFSAWEKIMKFFLSQFYFEHFHFVRLDPQQRCRMPILDLLDDR